MGRKGGVGQTEIGWIGAAGETSVAETMKVAGETQVDRLKGDGGG